MQLVIDQNQLRKKPLEAFLAASMKNHAVLTDTAFFEMLKGNVPIYVADRSLEILSRFPDQVLVTDGTGVLMRKELGERKAITTLVSNGLTDRFRATLRKARSYYEGKEKIFPIDEATVLKETVTIKLQRLDHDLHKKILQDGISALKKAPSELQKKMRKGSFDKEVYEFVFQTAFIGFRESILDLKFPKEVVEKLYTDYCLTARISMIGLLFAMQWFETHGADSLPKESVTNQLIDNDYVVSATYFDGILSEEKRLNALYLKMKDLLEANYKN
jgi:hypothetical protein